MFKNNWILIDKFWFNQANILNEFMDSEKKRILFSFYFFSLDDCLGESDYSRDDCIREGFQYLKEYDGSNTYRDLENKVKDILCEEYTQIFGKCELSTRDELYKMFINDQNSIFNDCFIYSIKELITREIFTQDRELSDFINERKVFVNSIDVSFTNNRLCKGDLEKKDLNYVWYEPKSKDDFYEVVKQAGNLFSCIITEDIDNFDNYLYAIEGLEQGDYLLAIEDRVGNFESEILPKIKSFLTEENVVYSEKEYFEITKRRCKDIKGK